MNVGHVNYFENFDPPQQEKLLSVHFLTDLFFNIMTLGIYGAVEIQGYQFELQILEKKQRKLLDNMGNLTRSWTELGDRLVNLIEEVNRLRETEENANQLQSLQLTVQQLFQEGQHLDLLPVDQENEVPSSKMNAVGLTIISFMGNWIATLFTIGFHNAYRNYLLKHQIKLLNTQNQHLNNAVMTLKNKNKQQLKT